MCKEIAKEGCSGSKLRKLAKRFNVDFSLYNTEDEICEQLFKKERYYSPLSEKFAQFVSETEATDTMERKGLYVSYNDSRLILYFINYVAGITDNICISGFITIENNLTYQMPYKFLEKLEDCNKQLVIIPTILKFNETTNHSTIMVIDFRRTTIEHFDPNEILAQDFASGYTTTIRDIVKNIYQNLDIYHYGKYAQI